MADQTTQQGGDDGKKPLDNKDLKVEKPLKKEDVVYENKIEERVKKTESKGERNELKQDITPINPFTPFQLKKDDNPPQLQPNEDSSRKKQNDNNSRRGEQRNPQPKKQEPHKKQEPQKTEYRKEDFVRVPQKNEKQSEVRPAHKIEQKHESKPQQRLEQKPIQKVAHKLDAKPEQKLQSEPKSQPMPKREEKPVTPSVIVNIFAGQEQKAEVKPEQKPVQKVDPILEPKPIQKQEAKPVVSSVPEPKPMPPKQGDKSPVVPNVPINPFAARYDSPAQKPENKQEFQPAAVPVNPFARPSVPEPKPMPPKQEEKPVIPNVPINPFARPSVPEPKPMPPKQGDKPVVPNVIESKPQPKVEAKSEQKLEQKPEAKKVPESIPQVIPQQDKKNEKLAPVMSPFAKENGEAKAINPFEKPDSTKKTFVDAKTVAEEKQKPNPFEQDKKEAVKVEIIEGGVKKSPLPRVTTVSAGKPEPVSSIPKANGDDFKSEFWQILEQAGITKGKLIGFAIALVVGIFVLLFFVFGWGSGGSGPAQQVAVVQEKTVESQNVPVANSKAYGLISSYIFGLEYGKLLSDDQLLPIGIYGNENGLIAGLQLGGIGDAQKIKFAYYTELLRRMQNVFEVDPYALLSQSTGRSVTLDKYLIDLSNIISEAMIAYSEIDQQANIWFAEYDQILKNQKSIELEFFNHLNNLKGDSSYKSLGTFMESTKQSSEIKAYANAYKSLRLMFVNSLNVLRPRYSDVYYNREALVKGIKVIDVPRSDINAIIRLP